MPCYDSIIVFVEAWHPGVGPCRQSLLHFLAWLAGMLGGVGQLGPRVVWFRVFPGSVLGWCFWLLVVCCLLVGVGPVVGSLVCDRASAPGL